MSITVVDSVMGSGKTSWAIKNINDCPDDNILYITPYLDETNRISRSVNRDMRCPKNRGDGKLNDLLNLLLNEEDVCSTHALFMALDEECKEAIKQGKYVLYLDETLATIEPYKLAHKDDIDYLLEHESIVIESDGFIRWTDKDMDTRFNPIKILAQNRSLFYVNKKLLMWRYPPDIFKLFDKVYILTYLFPASVLRYYFDLNNIRYEVKSVKRKDDEYVLCDYYKPDVSQYKDKIHIYSKSDLNDNFPQLKSTALSSKWFKNAKRESLKILKDNIYNFFRHKESAKANEIMWTTFKDFQTKLKGSGYTKGFVSCNCRATNDYAHTNHLAYCLNVYPHVGVSQFFSQHGIEIDRDLYALSEMIQWIWRSSIRNGGDIWIYIPSRRMRNLLIEWLDNKVNTGYQ